MTQALASGRALETFAKMVDRQGGDPTIVDDTTRLPTVAGRAVVRAPRHGHVVKVRAEAVGRASNVLGAGRTKVGDPVDHAVGSSRESTRGRSARGRRRHGVHHRDGRGLDEAMSLCAGSLEIADASRCLGATRSWARFGREGR